MLDQRGRDPHVVVGHHDAAGLQLVNMHERREWHAAFIPDSRLLMSAAFISKNSLVIRSSGGGPQESTSVLKPAVQASQIRLP